MKFKVENNQVSLNKTIKLSNKQLFYVKSMRNEADRQAYIAACMGLTKRRSVYVNRHVKNGLDILKGKRKGHYEALMRDLKDNSRSRDHKPSGKGNWIGVELEFVVPTDQCFEEECDNCSGVGSMQCEDGECDADHDCGACGGSGTIRNSGDSDSLLKAIRQELHNAKVYRASVRQDGSVGNEDDSEDNFFGVEVTLLINTDNGFGPLERLCEVLKTKFNADVNKTCGMHVHFDYSGREVNIVKQAAKRVEKFLPMLSRLVPKSRRDNHYCKLGVSQMRGGERYYAVNLQSFLKHGTIEIRLHGGTLDSDKIKNWVKLMRLIFDTKVDQEVKNVQDVLDSLNLSDELATYVDERYQKFNREEIMREERAIEENRLQRERELQLLAEIRGNSIVCEGTNESINESMGLPNPIVINGNDSALIERICEVQRANPNDNFDSVVNNVLTLLASGD